MSCVQVGSTNADIAGLGVVLAFAIQGGLSLVLSIWSFVLQDMLESGVRSSWALNTTKRDRSIDEARKEIYRMQRERIDKILATAADAQVLTGMFEKTPDQSER